MRTFLRCVLGSLLVAVLVTAGVTLRVIAAGEVDQRARADAIVVLGAAQYDGVPSEVFRARLDHAAALYRAGVSDHIVTIGGGQVGDRTTEGAAGRAYLADQGIPESALTAVGVGSDTLASLRAARPVLAERGWRSIVAVTDPWHAARTALMASDLGLQVQVSSVDSGPAVSDEFRNRYIWRETLAVLFYLATGASSGARSTVI